MWEYFFIFSWTEFNNKVNNSLDFFIRNYKEARYDVSHNLIPLISHDGDFLFLSYFPKKIKISHNLKATAAASPPPLLNNHKGRRRRSRIYLLLFWYHQTVLWKEFPSPPTFMWIPFAEQQSTRTDKGLYSMVSGGGGLVDDKQVDSWTNIKQTLWDINKYSFVAVQVSH